MRFGFHRFTHLNLPMGDTTLPITVMSIRYLEVLKTSTGWFKELTTLAFG